MTSLSAELFRVTPVVIVVAAVISVFPFRAVSFKASDVGTSASFPVAFVQLTPEQEESAVRSAKTAWLDGSGLRGRMTAHLPLGDLPENDPGPVLGNEDFLPAAKDLPVVPWPRRPYSPSLAAPSPVRLAVPPRDVPRPYFSRKELLELDKKGMNR